MMALLIEEEEEGEEEREEEEEEGEEEDGERRRSRGRVDRERKNDSPDFKGVGKGRNGGKGSRRYRGRDMREMKEEMK